MLDTGLVSWMHLAVQMGKSRRKSKVLRSTRLMKGNCQDNGLHEMLRIHDGISLM